jgi:hypothetical protein
LYGILRTGLVFVVEELDSIFVAPNIDDWALRKIYKEEGY